MTLLVAMVLPTAVFGAVLAAPRAYARLTRGRRRRRAAAAAALRPVWPPIEQLAAHLRRVRGSYGDPGRTRASREGARLAYLDLLVDACDRLDVGFRRDDLLRRRGHAHTAELLRVEAALAAAGLDVTTGPGDARRAA